MNAKALYNLSYGLFVIGVKSNGKMNACIIDTCMQVAANPVRVAISILNKNLTCEMLKESGECTISILDKTCNFNLIRNFGMQSGRNIDKFADFPYETNKNGVPYITQNVCALLQCKILSREDLGTHSLFVAEITDSDVFNNNPPLTYADYQNSIKQKNAENVERKIIGWRCKICGYEYKGSELPKDFECPICGHPIEDFEPIYE